MQFVLLKILYQRNWKAAIVAADGFIQECIQRKYIHWIYVYRLLKATFYLRSGSPGDSHAVDNLRQVAMIASSRDDNAVTVLASLLEGLTYLNSREIKMDTVEKIQNCLAQASKFQLDASAALPQLESLRLLLDMACDLHQASAKVVTQKLASFQHRMEDLAVAGRDSWPDDSSEIVIPVKRQLNTSVPISNETRDVLRPGNDSHDFLVVSFLSQAEASVLV